MFRRLVPAPGPLRLLATTKLISTIGDGIYYVTAALFFTRIVGLSPAQLGAGLTLAWAFGLVAGLPFGHLADRRGPRGTAVLLAVGAGLAVGSYLFIRSFPLFIIAACAYTICQRGGSAAQQALLAGLVEKSEITKTRAYIQSTYNAGLSVGAAIGGLALLVESRSAYLTVFAVDAVSFLAAALLLARLPAVAPVPDAGGPAGPRLAVFRDRPYVLISAINTILVLHIPLIDVALPLWIVRHTAAPPWVVSAVFVLNTVSVVLFQVRIARGVRDLGSASAFVRRAGVILFASCLAFASSAAGSSAWVAVAVLLFAAALQALGEMVQFSGTWEISFGLAPAGKQGQYQGFFGIGLTLAEMIGPLLLTSLVVYGGAAGWIVLGLALLGAGLAMGPAVRWAVRTRPAALAQPDVPVTEPSS